MRYQGGKSKIAKTVAAYISDALYRGGYFRRYGDGDKAQVLKNAGGGYRTFVSLFCGGLAVEGLVEGADRIILNDKHEYLIAMLRGVQAGYELPEQLTEEEYNYIKDHRDEDRVLTGFAGFGCSFGGAFFHGYAKDKQGKNYAAQSKGSLMRSMARLGTAEFTCLDYREVDIPDGSVVYADPPYADTAGYSTGKFDSEAFWEYMRKVAERNIVFVSELKAPSDFECIWERKITRTLDRNKDNSFTATEKLFIHT